MFQNSETAVIVNRFINLIDGVFIPGSNAFAMKYFAYANDVTLMLLGTYSVAKAFYLLFEYEMAIGIKIDFKKSKGFFCCKDRTSTFTFDALKQLKWRSDFIDILNIPFGSKQEIFRVFSAKINSVKNKVFKSKCATFVFLFTSVPFPKLHDF